MTHRASLWICAVSLAGCFDAHGTTEPDGAIAARDAGTSIADAGTPARDAGADAHTDGTVTRCVPASIGERLGDACFCNGPVALAGAVLYRRAVGIEVYDLADPRAPVLARVIEERASSYGVLLADESRGTLYSVANIDPSVWIYDLSAPLAPALLTQLPLHGQPRGGAVSEDTLVVCGSDGAAGYLSVFDVSTPSSPRPLRTLALEGMPSSVALEGRTAAVVASRGSDWHVTLLDVGSGAQIASLPLEAGGYDVALDGDRVYVTGGPRVLTVLRIEGSVLRVAGSFGEAAAFAGEMVIDGSRALIGGDLLRVFDISGLAPRLLGASAGPIGDVGGLASRGELAYVSGGSGVSVVALGCE